MNVHLPLCGYSLAKFFSLISCFWYFEVVIVVRLPLFLVFRSCDCCNWSLFSIFLAGICLGFSLLLLDLDWCCGFVRLSLSIGSWCYTLDFGDFGFRLSILDCQL